MENVEVKTFKNLKKLTQLSLAGNVGEIFYEEEDERLDEGCDCYACDLPDFVRFNETRAPSCYLRLP